MSDPLTREDLESSVRRSPQTKGGYSRSNAITQKLKLGESEQFSSQHGAFRPPDNNGSQDFLSSRRLRGSTPRQVVFYSDYLKDFDPATGELRHIETPGTQKVNPDAKEAPSLTDRVSKQQQGAETERPRENGRFSRETSELATTRGNYKRISSLKEIQPYQSTERAAAEALFTPKQTIQKHGNDFSADQVGLQNKSSVRERIARLNEKLNSPSLKTRVEDLPRNEPLPTEYKSSLKRSPHRRNVNAYQHQNFQPVQISDSGISPNFSSQTQRKSPEQRRSFNKNPEVENRYKLIIQEYENNITNLKEQISILEKRHLEDLNRVRNDLKEFQDKQAGEKINFNNKLRSETSASNQKISELQSQVIIERDRARLYEEQIVELKTTNNEKLESNYRDYEKILASKDENIRDLTEKTNSLQTIIRQTTEKTQFDHESALKRIKKEHEYDIAGLKSALEDKEKKITQLEREKRDVEETIVHKVQSIQVQLRGNQENNYRLRQTIESKEEEVNRLNKKISDLSKELLITKNENELLSSDKRRLEDENNKLIQKVERLDNIVYGR